LSKRKRKIMRSFVLNEISAVDKAAQVPAEAILMKRRTEKNMSYVRPRLTNEVEGHSHILDDDGQGGSTSYNGGEEDSYGHTHPWVRMLDGKITIGATDGHSHTLIDDTITAKFDGQKQGEPEMTKQETATVGDAEAVQKSIQDLTTRAERAEAIMKMDATVRGHFDSLPTEEQEKFLAKSDVARSAEVANAKDANREVYKSAAGEVFRASDDPRLVAMAKRSDADRQAAADAIEKVSFAGFVKRATEELANLPGTPEVKAKILKVLEGVEGAPEFLKAANEGAKGAFESLGAQGAGEGSKPEDQLEVLAQKYATDHSVTIVKAREAVLSTPEGGQLYQQL